MQDRIKLKFYYYELKKMFDVKAICYVGEPVVTLDYKPILKTKVINGDLIQCTGLKDFEGNLIFEGDFIKSNWHIYIVGFSRGSFDITDIETGGKYLISAITVEHSRIIGNKYNNPELLKGYRNEN